MPLESACIAYAGLANIALASRRYRPARPLRSAIPRPAAIVAGIALLILSAVLAWMRFGPYQGMVAWIGLLSLGGLALVLLMSRSRELALGLWAPIALTGTLLALL